MTDLVSRINELEEENMFLKNRVDFLLEHNYNLLEDMRDISYGYEAMEEKYQEICGQYEILKQNYIKMCDCAFKNAEIVDDVTLL